MPSQAQAIYLDNAATSFPKPVAVYDAVDQFNRGLGTAFGRGNHSGADEVAAVFRRTRKQLARLHHVDQPNQFAFTFNCTDSLNLVIFGVLRDGDRVVTTELEHNSVLRPLEQLQRTRQVAVERIAFDPATGRIDPAQAIETIVRTKPRLLVLNHASNVLGTVQPVDEIIDAAHQQGVLVLLDAAQTMGHLEIDLSVLKADFVAASGHKGLLGPLGTGVLFVREGAESELQPTRCGGTGSESESVRQPRAMPTLLESGNPNVPGICGLHAALGWITERGLGNIQQTLMNHTARLVDGLRAIDGVRLYPEALNAGADRVTDSLAGTQPGSIGVVSFNIEGLDPREAAMILDQSFNIRCRAGLHCAPLVHERIETSKSGGTVRFSPGVFTTAEQIDAAINAVREIPGM